MLNIEKGLTKFKRAFMHTNYCQVSYAMYHTITLIMGNMGIII